MVEQWLDSTGRVIREGYGQTETVRRSLLHESLVNQHAPIKSTPFQTKNQTFTGRAALMEKGHSSRTPLFVEK